jgi:uncharacterized protein
MWLTSTTIMLRCTMEFDRYTISLLMLRPDAPKTDEAAAAAQQDAHLSHLADLHQAGELLAVGPVLGPPDRLYRGLGIYRAEPERVRLISEEDPGVRAGRYSVAAYRSYGSSRTAPASSRKTTRPSMPGATASRSIPGWFRPGR